MDNTSTSLIGLNLTFGSHPLASFSTAIDRLLVLGSMVAEIPYRFPYEGVSYRISELSGRATRLVKEQIGRLACVSLHGPLGNTLLTNQEIGQAVVRSLRQAIQEAHFIGARSLALHIEPIFPNLELSDSQRRRSAEILRDLAEYAACYAVRLGLETEYPYTLADFIALIDEVDHPSFGATLDVGHLFDRRVPHHTYIDRDLLRSVDGPQAYNTLLQELALALLRRDKLFHVHLHQQRQEALGDAWPYGTCDHWALDNGFIDIPAFFRLLRQGGYNEMIVCELARGKNGPQAGSITDEEKSSSLALARQWWAEATPSAS